MASSSIEPFAVDLGDRVVTGATLGTAGVPLVLLHGIGSAARSFAAALPDLARTRRVVAWNAPGYAGSTAIGVAEPSAADYAGVLGRLVDALGFDRFHLLGHSLGAVTAARFAADHPDRLASLTLASVALGHARFEPARRAEALAARLDDLAALGPRGLAEKRGPRLCGPLANAAAVRAVVETMATIEPAGYADAARLLAGADTLADVARLAPGLPVLVVWGADDVITPPTANEAVVAARDGCRKAVVASAGHAFYVEKPAEFAALVDRFLQDAP